MVGGARSAGGPLAQGGPAAGGGQSGAAAPIAASGTTRRLFGTDGVRGVAGEVLTAELALRLGRSATEVVAGEKARKRPQFSKR